MKIQINFNPNIECDKDAPLEERLLARASNHINIRSALKRKPDANGNMIADGTIADGFNWVFEDDDVICCEHLHGTNASIICHEKDVVMFHSRRATFMNGLEKGSNIIFEAILNSINWGYLNLNSDKYSNGNEMYAINGTIFNGFFISRQFQAKKLVYGQWGKHPKTFENLSSWLKEDLATKANDYFGFNIDTGRPTCSIDPFSHRPYGLLFMKSDGRIARVTCDMFDWFHSERPKKVAKARKPQKTTKAQWEAYDEKQKEAIRQTARRLRYARAA